MQVNGVSTPTVTTTPAAITPPKPEAITTPADTKPAAIQPKHDTVELTGIALAKSLKLSGQTVAQIALKMHLDAKTVSQYLGVATKTATPAPATPAPAATPAPQAKQAATDSAITQQA